MNKNGAGVVEVEEGAWDVRLCKEIGRERVDVLVVQKPPYDVAATADKEGALTWAPTSGGGEGGREGDGSRERGGRMDGD